MRVWNVQEFENTLDEPILTKRAVKCVESNIGVEFTQYRTDFAINIDFRNLHKDLQGTLPGAFIVADDQAVLYRADGRGYDGIMGFFEPTNARRHLDAFAEPWGASEYRYETPLERI